MAIGDTVVSEGIEFEVTWNGGEGLTSNRETKSAPAITEISPRRRPYNKTGKHVGEFNRWHKKPKCRISVDATEPCLFGTRGCVVQHELALGTSQKELDNIRAALDTLERERKTGSSEPELI